MSLASVVFVCTGNICRSVTAERVLEHHLAESGAEAVVAGERGAVEHMNADHADALALYAAVVGEPGTGWRLTGLDPEGLDLMAGERTARVPYPEPVRDMGALRKVLVAMAASARSAGATGKTGTASA